MNITALGMLIPDEEEKGQLRSKLIPIPLLNDLPLHFIVADSGENNEPDFKRAVEAFLALGAEAKERASTLVYNNFLELREAMCYDDVGCEVKSEAKVWDHVHPTDVYVFRRREDGKVYVQVLAECDWEREHGLQLIFQDDSFLTNVSDQCGAFAWRES